MLDPVATVPHAVQGRVTGVDGDALVTYCGDLLTLAVVRKSERALMQLDAVGVAALLTLLVEAAEKMELDHA